MIDNNTSTGTSTSARTTSSMHRRPRSVNRQPKPVDSLVRTILDIRRVAKVGAGAKRFTFSVCAVVGDPAKGIIGIGIKKGRDIHTAFSKAAKQAQKESFKLHLNKHTIHHQAMAKFCSSIIMLKPASSGTGIKGSELVQKICQSAGIQDIVAKMYGSRNAINATQAIVKCLKLIKPIRADYDDVQPESTVTEEVLAEI